MRWSSRQTSSWILAVGTLATLVVLVAHAQGEPQRERSQGIASDANKKLMADTAANIRGDAQTKQDVDKGDPVAPPEPPRLAIGDPATQSAYLTAVQEYYRYRTSGFQHRRVVFEWQHRSSQVIFGVVLALVAIGIYFAAVQFHLGLRPKRRAPRADAGAESTELVASIQGIRVRSPVLGVIILVISMAFFYLYLAFVYPIQDVL